MVLYGEWPRVHIITARSEQGELPYWAAPETQHRDCPDASGTPYTSLEVSAVAHVDTCWARPSLVFHTQNDSPSTFHVDSAYFEIERQLDDILFKQQKISVSLLYRLATIDRTKK